MDCWRSPMRHRFLPCKKQIPQTRGSCFTMMSLFILTQLVFEWDRGKRLPHYAQKPLFNVSTNIFLLAQAHIARGSLQKSLRGFPWPQWHSPVFGKKTFTPRGQHFCARDVYFEEPHYRSVLWEHTRYLGPLPSKERRKKFNASKQGTKYVQAMQTGSRVIQFLSMWAELLGQTRGREVIKK